MDINKKTLKEFLEKKMIEVFEENDELGTKPRDVFQREVEVHAAGRASAFGDIYMAFYGIDEFVKFFTKYCRDKYGIR